MMSKILTQLTTRHKRTAKALLLLLSETSPPLKDGKRSEYSPPKPETTIAGQLLSKEKKKRIETLVGRGKGSSAL
ncbi:hypothetical protein BLNAU_16114 [Blattamonas nauphoetae]|uniref:Uncharacterized protein n=1 Tax=Blattamonas nauphoetae TaxID=2049346 RepID=A0ABQ9XF20_9EUKA|nr:hypothetical protein BLNAU_16114 [Blattamonas nauphoetae]